MTTHGIGRSPAWKLGHCWKLSSPESLGVDAVGSEEYQGESHAPKSSRKQQLISALHILMPGQEQRTKADHLV